MFKNESAYEGITSADDGYRMLALFRFWNMIYYFYPYTMYSEVEWRKCLPKLIRIFAKARDKEDLEHAYVIMLENLKDGHALAYGNDGNINSKLLFNNKNILPMDVSMVDSCGVLIKRINTSNVPEKEIMPGDIITQVNGKTIYDIRTEVRAYIPSSRRLHEPNVNAYTAFTGDSVIYTVRRDGQEKNIQICDFMRYWKSYKQIEGMPAECSVGNGISYINLEKIGPDHLVAALKKTVDSRGIIFDMRGYPDANRFGEMISMLADFLYPEEKNIMRMSYADLCKPGTFRENNYYNSIKYGKKNPSYYKGKVVVLVDNNTASAAEFVAIAIMVAPKSVAVGELTCGALGRITYIPLISGYSLTVSGGCTHIDELRNVDINGIHPDFVVHQIPEDLKLGKDTQLEFAKTLILK